MRIFSRRCLLGGWWVGGVHKATPEARQRREGGGWVGGVQGKAQKIEKAIKKRMTFGSTPLEVPMIKGIAK